MTKKKLLNAVQQTLNTKRDKIKTIPALLGAPINGQEQIDVSGRNGFVWVRLYDGLEIIQAYNSVVAPVYDLPILIAKDEYTGVYTVTARNLARYNNWGRGKYQNKHGWQHSFAVKGRDTVFTYNRQMLPFLTSPVGPSGSTSAYIWGAHYNWGGMTHYAGDTITGDLSALKPNGTGAYFHTLFLDQNTATFGISTGTTIYGASVTGTAAVSSYWPGVYDTQAQAAIAGIRLVSGTHIIDWDNIYNFTPYIGELTTTGTNLPPELNYHIRKPLDGGVSTAYDPTTAGLVDAVADLEEDDVLYVAPGSYTTDLTITQAYARIVGAGVTTKGTGYTQIRGKIHVADEVTFENISLYSVESATGTAYNVRPLGNGYYTYFNNVEAKAYTLLTTTGTVAATFYAGNGGWVQAYETTFFAYSPSGTSVFAYINPTDSNHQVDLYNHLCWIAYGTNTNKFTNNIESKTQLEGCIIRYASVTESLEYILNGGVDVNGKYVGKTTRVVSSPYNITSSDQQIFVNTDSGAITINLPVGADGRYLRIVNCGSSGNDVTVAPNGAELLLGSNSSKTLSDGSVIILVYESTEGWW